MHYVYNTISNEGWISEPHSSIKLAFISAVFYITWYDMFSINRFFGFSKSKLTIQVGTQGRKKNVLWIKVWMMKIS